MIVVSLEALLAVEWSSAWKFLPVDISEFDWADVSIRSPRKNICLFYKEYYLQDESIQDFPIFGHDKYTAVDVIDFYLADGGSVISTLKLFVYDVQYKMYTIKLSLKHCI